MKTSEIIRYLREKNNLTQEELANKLGLKKAAINKYENGTVENIKKNTIEDMAKIFEVSPSCIMGWEEIPYTPTVKLPILGSVRAGVGGFAYEEQIGYEESFTPNCSPETHFYLKVKGDSMEPSIKEGDLALVKRQSDVESGDLAIVLVNGEEGVIKRVIKKDNSIELHSFNHYYPPRIFIGKDMTNVTIIGKVIKTMSYW